MSEFKGIFIPLEVLSDDRLTPLEKMIFMEICALDQTENGCFASNEHIANICKCSTSKVTKAIAVLIKLNYLRLEAFNGRSRKLRGSIIKNTTLHSKIYRADSQNLPHSNIDSNIDSNIVSNKGDTNGSINTNNADAGKPHWSGDWY